MSTLKRTFGRFVARMPERIGVIEKIDESTIKFFVNSSFFEIGMAHTHLAKFDLDYTMKNKGMFNRKTIFNIKGTPDQIQKFINLVTDYRTSKII